MGYTTEFWGEAILNKPLDDDTYNLLLGLANTRRMARDLKRIAEKEGISEEEAFKKYGEEGEFYTKGKDMFGQDRDETIIDYNTPPKSQPGLWLQWVPKENRKAIEWDGGEKFYYATEWMVYIIDKILKPRGYVLNGVINAQGEIPEDMWHLKIENNDVSRIEHKWGEETYEQGVSLVKEGE